MTAPTPVLTHYTAEPFTLDATRTYDQTDIGNLKPRVLWLSDDTSFGWAEWCRAEDFKVDALEHATRFTLAPSANVLAVHTIQALRQLTTRWPRTDMGDFGRRYVDWALVAREYDGILITPYLWSAGLDLETIWYYGWDVASACIWNLAALTLAAPVPE